MRHLRHMFEVRHKVRHKTEDPLVGMGLRLIARWSLGNLKILK